MLSSSKQKGSTQNFYLQSTQIQVKIRVVGDPHGDGVEALPGGAGAAGLADAVQGDGVPAVAIQNGGKIVFHWGKTSFSMKITAGGS